MIFNFSSTCYAFYIIWYKIYCYRLKNVQICIIIDHHEYNHYDIVDVIWFTVIDESEHDVADVNAEGVRGDVKSICGGSGKPYVIVFSYKNCISYRTHCKKVFAKKWFYLTSIWLCLYMIYDAAKC